MPDTVTIYPVPDYVAYAYTVIDPRRVIIDRRMRRVVHIIECPKRKGPCRPGVGSFLL